MFVRFLCDWRPYKSGQCLEILDRIGADFVARAMAEVVSADIVRAYERTQELIARKVDRAVDAHFNKKPAPADGKTARRVARQDEWDAEKWDRLLKGKSAYEYLFGGTSLTVRS